MGGTSRNFDTGELVTYSNNLVLILDGDKDINCLKHCLHQANALQSQCDLDFNNVKKSIQDYQKKIEICQQEVAAAENEGAVDAELDLLLKDLEEEQEREKMLRDELRAIVAKINELENEISSVEERRKTLKKVEQEELGAQLRLSMYASVTNIIPDLDDPLKISGQIVEKRKKVVDYFAFDPKAMTAFDSCNSIWKMMNL